MSTSPNLAFTVLGTQPHLSLTELEAVIQTPAEIASGEVALFAYADLEGLQHRLGGAHKVGRVRALLHKGSDDEIIQAMLEAIRERVFESKVRIGLSVYNINDQPAHDRYSKASYRLQMNLKKKLQELGKSARIVTSKTPKLQSAAIKKNKLLEKGFEFVLITSQKGVYFCTTETVQNLDEWSYRDMHRPWRNAKQGMLPPKLARMMVNLVGAPAQGMLLDPFCGSGTVLMEASIVGWKCTGSDISEQAVHDTRLNMDWLVQKGFASEAPLLHMSAAENLQHLVAHESVDAIVTEPFLGDPRKGTERPEEIKRASSQLELLYTRSFRGLQQVLKPGGIIVISSPVHMVAGQFIEPDTIGLLTSMGFNYTPFKKDLLYKREGQFVARRLLRFVKP